MGDEHGVNIGINWVKAVEYLDDDDIKEIKRLGYDIKKLTCLHHVFKNKLM